MSLCIKDIKKVFNGVLDWQSFVLSRTLLFQEFNGKCKIFQSSLQIFKHFNNFWSFPSTEMHSRTDYIWVDCNQVKIVEKLCVKSLGQLKLKFNPCPLNQKLLNWAIWMRKQVVQASNHTTDWIHCCELLSEPPKVHWSFEANWLRRLVCDDS